MKSAPEPGAYGAGPSPVPVELKAFFALTERWGLSTEEQIRLLGSPGRSTFFKWKKEGGSLPADTTERISHVLGIWKSLKILFPTEDRGSEWLRRANEFFEGKPALDIMTSGRFSDLYQVRWYLDAQRGG